MSTDINMSIGMQCTSAIHLRDTGKRAHSFPFDWIVSHPSFVSAMMHMLMTNIPIETIVRHHFYNVDKRVNIPPVPAEHYKINDDPNCNDARNFNSKYNVVFPHEKGDVEFTIKKYIRRFERLKRIILDKSIHINFYYVSQSSTTLGNFTVNGENIVSDIFYHLTKIHDLIMLHHGNNFTIRVYDSINMDHAEKFISFKNIKYTKINSGNLFCELLPQLVD